MIGLPGCALLPIARCQDDDGDDNSGDSDNDDDDADDDDGDEDDGDEDDVVIKLVFVFMPRVLYYRVGPCDGATDVSGCSTGCGSGGQSWDLWLQASACAS